MLNCLYINAVRCNIAAFQTKCMRRFLILYCLLLALPSFAQVQNLIVTRPVILHEADNGVSPAVAHLDAGTRLHLLEAHMTGNYWHVQVLGTGNKGWVYKTYVAADTVHQPPEDHRRRDIHSSGVSVDSVSIRVVDVGNGLCTIIRLPHGKYVIYDAGGLMTSNGAQTWAQMQQFLPAGATVEFMVLSHMDGDHIAAASQAIYGYNIKKVIWGGYDRSIDDPRSSETDAFQRLSTALQERHNITESINLHERDSIIYPGNDVEISGVHFKLLCGFGAPLPEWGHMNAAERLNGVSIVMKLEYAGNSILFTGDAVGRRKDDTDSVCIATEKFLVDHAGDELKSTVMFAPHHGAENGSSGPFLDKVSPQYIVIAAGHVGTFIHPRKTTCLRYLHYMPADHIFRTDRGDDQGEQEWDYMHIPGCKDEAGDDDIQIDMRSDNKLHIYYLDPVNACHTHE